MQYQQGSLASLCVTDWLLPGAVALITSHREVRRRSSFEGGALSLPIRVPLSIARHKKEQSCRRAQHQRPRGPLIFVLPARTRAKTSSDLHFHLAARHRDDHHLSDRPTIITSSPSLLCHHCFERTIHPPADRPAASPRCDETR